MVGGPLPPGPDCPAAWPSDARDVTARGRADVAAVAVRCRSSSRPPFFARFAAALLFVGSPLRVPRRALLCARSPLRVTRRAFLCSRLPFVGCRGACSPSPRSSSRAYLCAPVFALVFACLSLRARRCALVFACPSLCAAGRAHICAPVFARSSSRARLRCLCDCGAIESSSSSPSFALSEECHFRQWTNKFSRSCVSGSNQLKVV